MKSPHFTRSCKTRLKKKGKNRKKRIRMRKRRGYVTIKADTVRTILKILIKSSHKK